MPASKSCDSIATWVNRQSRPPETRRGDGCFEMEHMKNTAISFSSPMIRAILEGHKTQTRRVIKPQPPAWCQAAWMSTVFPANASFSHYLHANPEYIERCPYGGPGDRLWVRKTRITLDVTEVRVQWVEEISEEDAVAEGFQMCCPTTFTACPCGGRHAREQFYKWWDSINAKRPGCSWSDNPWVFAISFRCI